MCITCIHVQGQPLSNPVHGELVRLGYQRVQGPHYTSSPLFVRPTPAQLLQPEACSTRVLQTVGKCSMCSLSRARSLSLQARSCMIFVGKCSHRSMRVRALSHTHVLCPIHECRFLDHRLRRRGHSKLAMSYLSRSAPCTRWNPSCVSANMKKSQCRCVHACERALMQTCTHVIAHECICVLVLLIQSNMRTFHLHHLLSGGI